MIPATSYQTGSKSDAVVAKLWSYCNVLTDHGLSTIEYVEQLTYLLFLKMADEIARNKPHLVVPAAYSWQSLAAKTGPELEAHYRKILTELGKDPSTTLGTIFANSRLRITEPTLLERLIVNLIGKEDWTVHSMKEVYEGLLANAAEDTRTSAGQYFTPRALIGAIVDVMQPQPGDTITDPICGTGGFLVASHGYLRKHHMLDLFHDRRNALGSGQIWGTAPTVGTARFAAMNMLLHGMGSLHGLPLVAAGDALATKPGRQASLVLTNPPFGRKSAMTIAGSDGKAERERISYARGDFCAATANRHLNFLQHTMSLLEVNGRAAVVLPDSALFEGGAGEKVRRRLLDEFSLHTILRLPAGIFHAGGVRANVLFFERKPARAGDEPSTSMLWVYDFRTGKHFTPKQRRPLHRGDLREFVEAYLPGKSRTERVETERFKCFGYDDLIARDRVNLDITWTTDPALDGPAGLLPPEMIAREIVEDLQAALNRFTAVAEALGSGISPYTDAFKPPDIG
ncbi:class I SAM-dependent DNA methyltransferase [Streptomyces sp. NBC_01481]|uniref:class I SAM-dependent DNA methyltransferase n=1 Tax=Streptomyces sp. NBC_01481 TaxID=2975869 RepID=UPI00224CE8DD|nr:class I SAM-dependent DNA methyltransferase [Streptomyces sp. NBC_01481]MCX4587039.1 type I restriction-modification system subunit M [Streptomyces sp. NBC_01481]